MNVRDFTVLRDSMLASRFRDVIIWSLLAVSCVIGDVVHHCVNTRLKHVVMLLGATLSNARLIGAVPQDASYLDPNLHHVIFSKWLPLRCCVDAVFEYVENKGTSIGLLLARSIYWLAQ